MIGFIITFAEWFLFFCLAVTTSVIVGWVFFHIFKSIYERLNGD